MQLIRLHKSWLKFILIAFTTFALASGQIPEPNFASPQTLEGPQVLVYSGLPQSTVNAQTAARIQPQVVRLPHLLHQPGQSWRLQGTQVEFVNRGVLVQRDKATGQLRAIPMGNAAGQSLRYDPASGGPLPRHNERAAGRENQRALSAGRFGEVNAYYHADRTLTYANSLLRELGEKPLPYLRIVVNDHYCSRLPGYRQNDCDRRRSSRSRSFGGGHYRLPTTRFQDEGFEHSAEAMHPGGEVHLGSGNSFIKDARGARVVVNGYPYSENSSHNAGIIVHEVGHHINSHTADFRANRDRSPQEYSNRKIHLDEGTADYWTAVMLHSPDIYEWHDAAVELADSGNRNLSGLRTTADFIQNGDPHKNGNIWSSALWDLRQAMNNGHNTDLLVMKALVLMGQIGPENPGNDPQIRKLKIEHKDEFQDGLLMLLKVDCQLYGGRYRPVILKTFVQRGIGPGTPDRDFEDES